MTQREPIKINELINNTTELVFILDKSGSMSGLEADTVGGFNSMLKEQKEQDGKCFVTTILFNHMMETLHDRKDVKEVGELTGKDYRVGGSTALVDAIGQTIKHIAFIHKYARPEDVPAHTMFVITTDGMENSSHMYSADEVRAMIKKEKEKYGWEFLFIGANIDAVETAKHYGIDKDHAVNYMADSIGTETVFTAVNEAACCVRSNKVLMPSWSKAIDADYKKRKRK